MLGEYIERLWNHNKSKIYSFSEKYSEYSEYEEQKLLGYKRCQVAEEEAT